MAFTVSGTVAVRGDAGEAGGSFGLLSRPDIDRCGHFRRLFTDLCVCVCARVCVWGGKGRLRGSAYALYSDSSLQSESI